MKRKRRKNKKEKVEEEEVEKEQEEREESEEEESGVFLQLCSSQSMETLRLGAANQVHKCN